MEAESMHKLYNRVPRRSRVCVPLFYFFGRSELTASLTRSFIKAENASGSRLPMISSFLATEACRAARSFAALPARFGAGVFVFFNVLLLRYRGSRYAEGQTYQTALTFGPPKIRRRFHICPLQELQPVRPDAHHASRNPNPRPRCLLA